MRERLVWIFVLILMIFITGCGREPGTESTARNVGSETSPNTTSPAVDTPGGEEDPSPSPSLTPSTLTQSYSASTLGTQVFHRQVETGNVLILTLKPMLNDNSDHGCVSFKIDIAGTVFYTGVLRVENLDTGNCPGAPTSFLQDFSNLLLDGSNTIDISINAQQNDKLCYTNGIRCPLFQIGSNDQIRGQLTVETNLP